MPQKDSEHPLNLSDAYNRWNPDPELTPPVSRGRMIFYSMLTGALAGGTAAVALHQVEQNPAVVLLVPLGAALGSFGGYVLTGLDLITRPPRRY